MWHKTMLIAKYDTDANRRAWQAFLNTHGENLTVDGRFGAMTDAATRRFQKMCVLREDGIVGAGTIAQAVARGLVSFETVSTDPAPAPSAKMQMSEHGQDFLKGFEELRLTVYNDGYGFPTVGWGHKIKAQDHLKIGDTITQQQADEFWARDLAIHADIVDRHVKVPLTQGQYDALVSLAFNIGEANFADSSLLSKLNRGDYAGAQERFDGWIRSNGKVSNGLIRRRDAEQEMFNS
ncbi:MAG: glycoside hydrolase family protein [Pyrinomonadaceae bacterium]